MAVFIAPAAAGAGTIPAPPWRSRAAFAGEGDIIGASTCAHPVVYDTRMSQNEATAARRSQTCRHSRESQPTDSRRPSGLWKGRQMLPTSAVNSTQKRNNQDSAENDRRVRRKTSDNGVAQVERLALHAMTRAPDTPARVYCAAHHARGINGEGGRNVDSGIDGTGSEPDTNR